MVLSNLVLSGHLIKFFHPITRNISRWHGGFYAQIVIGGNVSPRFLTSTTTAANKTLVKEISSNQMDLGSRVDTPIPTHHGERLVLFPPRPTDELVRKILATEDMKRTLGRELRKCDGSLRNLNYSRVMYGAWNGFTEQIVLSHIESAERLIQLIKETMEEDPAFKAFVENTLNERDIRIPFGRNSIGTKNLSWCLSGAALILAFFNYYLTAILLFAGAIYVSFFFA